MFLACAEISINGASGLTPLAKDRGCKQYSPEMIENLRNIHMKLPLQFSVQLITGARLSDICAVDERIDKHLVHLETLPLSISSLSVSQRLPRFLTVTEAAL